MKPVLTMMVKNEGKIIQRALDSAKPYISGVALTDTGSTDDTISKVGEWCRNAGIPYSVAEIAWKDFGHGRTAALHIGRNLARKLGSQWLLLFDPDETLEGNLPDLDRYPQIDVFNCRGVIPDGDTYTRAVLINVAAPVHYVGVTHEALVTTDPDGKLCLDWADDLRIVEINDSARRATGKKQEEDIALLEKACSVPNPVTRDLFYLARAYQAVERFEDSDMTFRFYLECEAKAAQPFYEQMWYARCRLGTVQESLDRSPLQEYLEAYSERDWRAEPLVWAAVWCKSQNMFPVAAMLLEQATKIPKPRREAMPVYFDCYGWKVWATLEEIYDHMGETGKAFVARGEKLKAQDASEA